MNRKLLVVLAATVILSTPSILLAQYTLVLKNGGKLTVQSYREEGQVTKVYSSEGELAIPRDQIQSIVRAGENQQPGAEFRGGGSIEGEAREAGQEEQRAPGQPPRQRSEAPAADQPTTRDESPPEVKPNEEEEYRRRVEAISRDLRATRDSYLAATRGTSSPDPTLLNGEDAIRTRSADLSSRLKDSQRNPIPGDAGPVKLQAPSPFTGQPPVTIELRPGEVYNSSVPIYNAIPALQPSVEPPLAPYSDHERELSDLRNRMNQLVKEREKLIEEMKQKNFNTADLFVD
jgi:hypothetical protein